MKRIVLTFLLVVGLVCPKIICNSQNGGQTALVLKSQSAILMDARSGTIIFEKNADERLKPASVTKIMTLLLTFEAIERNEISLLDTVTISKHAASMGGSQCFFEEGEEQSVEDLIKCIAIASGNDAAVAMAEYIAGSEEAFKDKMNEKAKELGMNNTNFENACGLDSDNHKTCARDIAIMTKELICKYPQVLDYSGIWMDSITHKTRRGESRFDLVNTNKFLNWYTGATGLKTGYTKEAGYCISATAKRDNIELIAVVMKADTKENRNNDIKTLLDYGFSCCTLYEDKDEIDNLDIKIKKSDMEPIAYKVKDNRSFLIFNKNVNDVEREIIIYDNLTAPIKKGSRIGEVVYKNGEEILYKTYILADENVDKTSYLDKLFKISSKIFMLYTGN